jgi:putative ABC transport system permease protein
VGAALAGILCGLALALASIGVFGVFAYVVQQRTREIGIRMALGARRAQVLHVVLGFNSRALVAGLTIGLASAAVGSRLLQRYLYGLSPFDPLAYGAVALLLALAAVIATYLPARRASKVDPIRALRYE